MQSIKKIDEKNSVVYEKLFNTAYYIAIEGEPMTKFPKLLELQEKNGVEVESNYRNNHGCCEFIKGIAGNLQSVSKTKLEEARFIKILSDGSTTDKSIFEQEIIYVQYVDKSCKLKTRLENIVEVKHDHSKGVKDGIYEALLDVGLSKEILTKKLVGINTVLPLTWVVKMVLLSH